MDENSVFAGNKAEFVAAITGGSALAVTAKTADFADLIDIGNLDVVADTTFFRGDVTAADSIVVTGDQVALTDIRVL